MATSTIILLAVIGGIIFIAFIIFVWFIGVYNKLVGLRNQFKNAFAQIDVQLKRRYDLIPNLVETAKGYMAHEKGTLEAVIRARSSAMGAANNVNQNPGDPNAIRSLAGAEGELTSALGRLMVVVEAYPDLKANQNMLQVQEELTSTENKIAFARQAYNDSVMIYNTQRELFPSNFVANFCNFTVAASWEIENTEERNAPQVKF